VQGAATVRAAFRSCSRGKVGVDAQQKRTEPSVVNNFADHQILREDETIEASSSGFIAVNRFERP
jgi:hypothetical protein